MFKSGNMDVSQGLCPKMGASAGVEQSVNGAAPSRRLFNNLPMNQPLLVHQPTAAGWPLPYNATGSVGYYAGTCVSPAVLLPLVLYARLKRVA